jgi:hypothetical protein
VEQVLASDTEEASGNYEFHYDAYNFGGTDLAGSSLGQGVPQTSVQEMLQQVCATSSDDAIKQTFIQMSFEQLQVCILQY